jgi:capsular exopolysaccharide synthesis family protein
MSDLSKVPEMRPEAAQPPSWVEEQQTGLRDYLDIVRRRLRIVIGAFVAALAVAVAVSLTTPPTYRASTTITTDKTPPAVLTDRTGELNVSVDLGAAQAPDVLTLVELIKSEAVRDGAMFRLAPTVGTDAARGALNTLSVQQVRQTELVRINIEYTNPRVAAEAANAVADALVDMNLKATRRRATETRDFIGRELQEASRRLRAAEDAMVAFRDRNGDIALSQQTTLSLQKLADLQAQLVDVRLQRETVQQLLASARGRLANQANATPTAPNPVIASLQEELAKLEIELSGLRLEFTPKHPAILSTTAKIEETKQHLNAELGKTLRGEMIQAETNMASLNSRERAMQNVIAGYAERMRGVPLHEVDLARLTRDVKESEAIYLLLSDRYEHARISENSIGSVIRVVDAAKAPGAPVKPRRQTNTLFGGLLGLMVGVVGALVVEQLDDTVKSAEEIERVLGAPVLGAIPIVGGAHTPGIPKSGTDKETAVSPPLAATDRHSRAAEAYRALRTHVLFSMPDVERKRLLVTSALPREGKSTVVVNLAVAIADTDRRVWLIDGDMRRPTLSHWFGGAGSAGLAGVLAGQADVDTVVRQTAEPNLWYVESGPTAPNPAELLGSQRMARLMERARAEADVVLVDSPPMLPVTDAEVVAAQSVDGVLLIVKAGETNKRALAYVRKRLERVGAKLVGAVLNGVPNRGRDGYSYGSYYDSYYGEEGSRGKVDSESGHDPTRREDA